MTLVLTIQSYILKLTEMYDAKIITLQNIDPTTNLDETLEVMLFGDNTKYTKAGEIAIVKNTFGPLPKTSVIVITSPIAVPFGQVVSKPLLFLSSFFPNSLPYSYPSESH